MSCDIISIKTPIKGILYFKKTGRGKNEKMKERKKGKKSFKMSEN
jgi:hypothetical protein